MEIIDRIWNDLNLKVAQNRREFTLLRIWNLTCRQESFTLLAPCWWSKCELPDLTLHYAIIAQADFLFEICRLTGIQPYKCLPTVITFRSSWRRDMDIYVSSSWRRDEWSCKGSEGSRGMSERSCVVHVRLTRRDDLNLRVAQSRREFVRTI